MTEILLSMVCTGMQSLMTDQGVFDTMSNTKDKNFVRDKLVVKENWKPEINRVNTYEVVKPLPANVGEVGPQVDIPADRYLKGGSDQIEMLVEPRDRMDYIKLIDSRRIEEWLYHVK